MSVYLPDVNVLIAVVWPSHIHHRIAREWFSMEARSGWATCPFTQAGFIRISSNPAIITDAVSPREAIAVLTRLTDVGQHEFWRDELSCAERNELPVDLLIGHRQVTDAYLLGLAILNEGRLATMDRGIMGLLPTKSHLRTAIELIST